MTKNYYNLSLLSLLILLLTISCNTLFKKDHSLKPEEYIRLGMPDQKKVWTNDDYASCNITLSSLKMNYPLSLPRKSSKKSGTVFSRMVNVENLNFIYDTIFPLRIRAYAIQYYPRFQTEMEQMYSVKIKDKNYYSEELAAIHVFGLQVTDKMLELAATINNSGDDDALSIKDGMEAVKYNYIKLIQRLLNELTQTDQYPARGLELLSKAILNSLSKNYEWMTPKDKIDILSMFNSTLEKTKISAIKENLKVCIETLSR
jgi:hypothetical protein